MTSPYYKNKLKSKINPISNKRYELFLYMYSGSNLYIVKNSLIVEGSLDDSAVIEGESIELIYDKKKIKADNKHLL